MSRLETPDPDGAQVFYATLFGWTTEASDIGGTRITVFRLPGYVGGESEQAFPRAVVATMSDVTGDAPAHWSVRFWGADVDAAAATAKRLQGTIVAGPFDIPIGQDRGAGRPRACDILGHSDQPGALRSQWPPISCPQLRTVRY
jgi:predicted enzyme related to lactoylglutathione lyase